MTQKITPFLWFDTEAEAAMSWYVSLFDDAGALDIARTGDGAALVARFRAGGLEISLLNGGPAYAITPAVSFFVTSPDAARIDALWAALTEGGTALMALDAYPFSERYGWVQDRYGVSWQLSLSAAAPSVTPFLMFVGDNFRRAEEAMGFYTSLFADSRIDQIERYGPDMHEPEGR